MRRADLLAWTTALIPVWVTHPKVRLPGLYLRREGEISTLQK
jgi:hypothetical protein